MKAGKVVVHTIFVLVAATGCITGPIHQETTFEDYPAPRESYASVLDKWTQATKAYNGIIEIFQIGATLLSSDVLERQIFVDANQFHWTEAQFKESRQKVLYESQTHTTVFVSFFTQKDTDNNLDKTPSLWNIYLEVGGARVKPSTIKRNYENAEVLTGKYPYHNIWSRAYTIDFPLDTARCTGGATLVVAGPIGDAHLKFPKGFKE